MKFDKQDNCSNQITFQLHSSPLVFCFADLIAELPTMLISGSTVEPRNLVCTKWFSDNTFFTTRLENWSRFFKSVLHSSYIQSLRYPHDRIHFLCDIYISALIFFSSIYLLLFFFVCYTLFFPFSYPFFTLISYLTNSFSIPQIDKWKKKTYKRAHYPKKEYATYQPNTLCFAPALLLIPDIQDRRWAKVQVRKRMGLIISKYRLGYRHTGYGCRKKWNKIYHMDRTETEQQTGKPALNDKCCLFCGFISLTPTPRKSYS